MFNLKSVIFLRPYWVVVSTTLHTTVHSDPSMPDHSFEIVSLFARVPIRETMSLVSRHFEEDILRLFRHTLTSYISFTGQFYEQFYNKAMV
jgi:hypothetical protein